MYVNFFFCRTDTKKSCSNWSAAVDFVFACEFFFFAISSQYQNVEESRVQVRAQLWYLQTECHSAFANSDEFGSQTRFLIGRHAAAFFLKVSKLCTNKDQTLLHILILGTYTKFVWKNASARRLPPAALLERWPQECRFNITFALLPTICFVSTTTNSMKMSCEPEYTENPRSFEKYPTPPCNRKIDSGR